MWKHKNKYEPNCESCEKEKKGSAQVGIVAEKYIALTIVLILLSIIIAVYKSIAINYYLLKVQNTIAIAIHSDSEVLIFYFYFFLNFVFGSL